MEMIVAPTCTFLLPPNTQIKKLRLSQEKQHTQSPNQISGQRGFHFLSEGKKLESWFCPFLGSMSRFALWKVGYVPGIFCCASWPGRYYCLSQNLSLPIWSRGCHSLPLQVSTNQKVSQPHQALTACWHLTCIDAHPSLRTNP